MLPRSKVGGMAWLRDVGSLCVIFGLQFSDAPGAARKGDTGSSKTMPVPRPEVPSSPYRQYHGRARSEVIICH